MSRALILGGGGMLGRAVRVEGRRRGQPVLALSRLEADVTDLGRVQDAARSFRPETIFNCAAFTQVDACESERERAHAVNGRGVIHAAAAAAAVGATLVQVSTDYVFDGKGAEPYREDAPTAPLSVYGQSKLEGEQAALAYDRGLVVRTSWLFGPGGPNFVATIRRLLGEGRPLRVVDDQVGCPTYTPFLARALWDLADGRAERAPAKGPEILHYRNREPVSWHGFATAIARQLDAGAEIAPVATAEFPRPAPRPAYSVLDVGRCEAALGRAVEPWERGLAEYLSPSVVPGACA